MFLTLLFLATPVRAQDLPAAEAQAIRAVINAQIAAFRADDAEGAFRFASPAIQKHFGSPEAFMALVERDYHPVYRAREVSFRTLHQEDGKIFQEVVITTPGARPVTAIYLMEKQADGTWRIGGCVLMINHERPT